MSQSAALRRPLPLVLADLLPGTVVRDVLLVAGAAGFVGALAQISIHLSFTPVPITGQTLGVLVACTALGWRRAVAAMGLYAVAGIAGVPWFADHASGYVGASFGYILGYVLAAVVCGLLAERGAALAYCPGSNMFLGDGVTRVPELLRAGVRVGLGTDGGCTNNRLSVFEEMRMAS